MILKKLQRTNLSKTKAAMIGGLVDYVLAQKDEEGKQKRLYAYGMNFLTTTTAAWKQEMIALSEESIKSRMPVSHWAMSWQENEIPSHEQVQEAVNIFLERMGLKGHQAIVAAHGNTGNFHIHIVVNRTHPYTEKVIQPHRGFDIEAAHRIVAEIEHKQGWASQDHARYRVNEKGEIVRNRQLKQVKPDSRAEDFENATGEKSAQRIAQERGHAIIANARTWKDLHEGLTRAGLRFKKKGSGAVVFVGEIEVKLSSVDRKFGFANLCKRLGEYEEGEYPEEAPKMEPEPVRHVCVEEWREYQKEREEASEERRVVRRREAENMRQEKERQHARRDSALAALARHELSVLNIARHCLKKQEEETAQARQNLPPRKIPPVRRFKHWLGKRSPSQSVAVQTADYARHAGQAVRVSQDRRIGRSLPCLSGNGETTFFRYAFGTVASGLHDGPVSALRRIHEGRSIRRAFETQPRPVHPAREKHQGLLRSSDCRPGFRRGRRHRHRLSPAKSGADSEAQS